MYLSRALEWMSTALRVRRTPGRHSRPTAPQAAPQAATEAPRRLTPDVWGARLAIARSDRRQRREAQAWQPQPRARARWFPPRGWEAEHSWERPVNLVRPYVTHLGAPPRTERTGAQVSPWVDGR